jgi:hypothetical protein
LVRDIDTLRRIRSLAIPPAWTDAWISRDPNGHLQAAGRDKRGSEAKRKKAVLHASEDVATHLGNTPAVCRRCYIHLAILDGYVDGTLLKALAEDAGAYLAENIEGMTPEEIAVTALLRLRLEQLAAHSPTGPAKTNGTAKLQAHPQRVATPALSAARLNPAPPLPLVLSSQCTAVARRLYWRKSGWRLSVSATAPRR